MAILLEGFAERASEDEKTIRVAFENERLKKFKSRLRKAFMAGSIYFQFQFWKSYALLCRTHGGWEGLELHENPESEAHSDTLGGSPRNSLGLDGMEEFALPAGADKLVGIGRKNRAMSTFTEMTQGSTHSNTDDGTPRTPKQWHPILEGASPALGPVPPSGAPPPQGGAWKGSNKPTPPQGPPPLQLAEFGKVSPRGGMMQSSVVTPLEPLPEIPTARDNLDEDEGDEELDEEDEEYDEVGVDNKETNPFTYGNSLFLFPGDHCLRMACASVVRSPLFDQTILFFIGLNSVTMAIERPAIADDSKERLAMNVMGFIFTGIFVVEMAVKVISWGFFFGPHAYLNDYWNMLDGFLVTVSVIDFIFIFLDTDGGSVLGILRILRLLRALRPLRVINRAPKLKRVVQTLMDSLGSIWNTIMISSVVYLIFGILSVQLFSGKLFACDNTEGTYNGTSITVVTKDDCAKIGGSWDNQMYNYDNLFQALLTLFYVSSFDGWVDVMYYSIDAKAVEEQPVEDHNELVALFFIIFLLIANFFILNMFVGVIVESFQMSSDPDQA